MRLLLAILLLLVPGCSRSRLTWPHERTFSAGPAADDPKVTVRAYREVQSATHGGLWSTTWYNVETVLTLPGHSVVIESVMAMGTPSPEAKRARERDFQVRWSDDREAVLLSYDQGKAWLVVAVALEAPVSRGFLVTASALSSDTLSLLKLVIPATLGLSAPGVVASELACDQGCGFEESRAVGPAPDRFWTLLGRAELVEDGPWFARMLPALLPTVRTRNVRDALATLDRALEQQPVREKFAELAGAGAESPFAGVLCSVLSTAAPARALELGVALLEKPAGDSLAEGDQRLLAAWTLARTAHRHPALAAKWVTQLESEAVRLFTDPHSRRQGIFLVQALTFAPGGAATQALERLARPSAEVVANLERQYVTVDRSDLIQFPASYVAPFADLGEERTTELHDWAAAGLKFRGAASTEGPRGPRRPAGDQGR